MDKRTQRKKIAGNLFRKGLSQEEIAETLGCGVSTVSVYLYELGLRQRKALGLGAKCVELHLKGYSNSQIAYELEISKSYVYEQLRER